MATVDLNALFTAPDADDNDSRKGMIYTADNGEIYKVNISENIGEAFGFTDLNSANSLAPTLPQRFKMRKLYAVSSNGNVRQSFVVGDPTADIYVEGGQITVARKGKAAGLVLSVTGTVGEARTFATFDDSGQQSGDIS